MTFEDFYRDRRGFEPFPWMGRLAKRLAALVFPDVVDLPTGSGKSDLVYAWAWARQQNPAVPRRLWMVTDRRIIVDQTFEVARPLERDNILVSRLRGGIVRDDDDVLDPVAAQIITTTVDQLGSRLLFRAYGASPRSWPIWAGLAGNDSLIVLDEAHLSPVAEETFRSCQHMGAAIRVISVTATPRLAGGNRLELEQEDRDHSELGRRVRVKRVVEMRDKGSLTAATEEILAQGRQRVAVICNTVRQARATYEQIPHADKHLLIGRQRPLDRDRLLEGLLPRLKSGAAATPPLVVVATQCVEAGADFDFDGMVSEACPIDALRQRLGRLNRLGRAGESRCVLMRPENAKATPPYGAAPDATWKWLQKHAKKKLVDLGGEGWEMIREFVPEEARSSRPQLVSFLEPHLRMLARTSPRPRVEPDVDLLLHGDEPAPGAVTLVWRRDVDVDDVDASNEILAILPPDGLEGCEVPVWEVRAWLEKHVLTADAGDVEGAQVEQPDTDTDPGARRALRWLGTEDGAEVVTPRRLLPGDVIVVPAKYGGYDAFGWHPASIAEVQDLAEQAYHQRTGSHVERHGDPDADVSGDRVIRWSSGVVVISFTVARRSRQVTREVKLDIHQQAVAQRAREYASALALDGQILAMAGLHHDDGKADRRWQLCIKGGNCARLAEPPLAKGKFVRSPLARLAKGWRHEAESLRLLPTGACDLVRWLVATHHGYARPFWPIADHGLGLAELMDRLQSEYGCWRLALYEATLRCADRAVSREEMADE